MKPMEPVLEAGAQIQQMLTAECIEDFIDAPSMSVSFVYNNVPQKITMKLPLTLNKFFEPTEMNGESFFARWKNLGGEQQRAQKIFKAQGSIDIPATRTKLAGFGMQLLDGIDPNPDNFVCAGIVHTRVQQVGCLMRLEPNKQAQMFRLTVRSSKETVSHEICNLLADQF
uniref:Clathrin adaptor alpha-adaptin appendage C-terminal subdomain domain-containing protein n=1 Tax=Heliothis virescens TaxID=7102 RepID=A0A2A4IVS9_HELVI